MDEKIFYILEEVEEEVDEYLSMNCCPYCGVDFDFVERGCILCPPRVKDIN